MAWIEVHQALLTHRKTLRLARLLGLDRFAVVGRLMALWCWALDNAPDGHIPAGDADLLADVMGWEGELGVLTTALRRSGFLDADRDGDAYTIHDWDDYAGKLVQQRKANADRQRAHRERVASRGTNADVMPPGDTRNGDMRVTSPLRRGATVPNSTQPESTSGDVTVVIHPTAEAERAKDSTKPPMPLAAIFGGDGGAEPLNLFVARVASAAGMRQYNAATFSNILAPYHARSPDRVVSEAAAAAEWIADPRQNKKRTQMSITFLHRWLDRGFNSPQGQNGHARHDSTETDSEHLSLDERRKRREAREASERGERQRERANLTARLGPPGTQRHPAG